VRRRGIRFARMKIATWNVNGIPARQAQLEAWMASERLHPEDAEFFTWWAPGAPLVGTFE
jgi:hypothetical protein